MVQIMKIQAEVYGDTAQFTKEGDKFTALLLGFPLWRVKGGRLIVAAIDDLINVGPFVVITICVPGYTYTNT